MEYQNSNLYLFSDDYKHTITLEEVWHKRRGVIMLVWSAAHGVTTTLEISFFITFMLSALLYR